SNTKAIDQLIGTLSKFFSVKDLGQLSFFLGVETLRMGANLFLTQRKYIGELLRKVNMDNVKPCATPMATTCHLSKFEGVDFNDPQLYRSTVGALHYLGFTHPDIAYSVHRVSKFMHQPKEPHWQAVKRILRYLKHTISFGLHFSRQINKALHSFSDADWAGDSDDRRS
ncbi:hypothetical protein F2P56_001320, partial [Juglans regia]